MRLISIIVASAARAAVLGVSSSARSLMCRLDVVH